MAETPVQSKADVLVPLESPYGILVFDDKHSWDSLRIMLEPDLDRRGLERLRPVLCNDCRCVVIESQYIDKDYRDTFSSFHSKRFNTPPSRCKRLHFFKEEVTEKEIVDAGDQPEINDEAEGKRKAAVKKLQTAYLGYSVIRPTKPNCIGRTMLTHHLRADKDGHLSICDDVLHLLGTQLNVKGFPFISQDADATVCAQAALWMLLRYYSSKYAPYSEILPYQITQLAHQYGVGSRLAPSSGLYSWQLAEALRSQRFFPVVYSRREFPKDFDHWLYTYIESGMPLLVTLKDHVMVSYGHTSDYTVAQIEKEATSLSGKVTYTSHFNRGFVVNDDNFFPYQTLWKIPRTNDLNNTEAGASSKFGWNDIEEFIVPLPEKVFLRAEDAQSAITAILMDTEHGVSTSPALKNKPLLLRLFLISSRAFKRVLHQRGMGHEIVERFYRHLPMPHFIWVCELADYSEYATKKHVVGEVLWDATRNAKEPNGWIALHYPERLVVDIGSAYNARQNLQIVKLPRQNSYSLFKFNLHSL